MTFGVLVRQPVPKRHLSSKIFLPVYGGLVGLVFWNCIFLGLVRLPVIKICNGGIPVLPVQGGAFS